MLIKLRIKDYILIDELEVDFSEGFNVLTGETGAGKSILLGALRLVLGERAQGDLIRQGAQKAIIQAQFSGHEDALILTRELLGSGKSTCKINGDLCTLGELKALGEQLLTIHGQNDHQQLNHSDKQLQMLDQLLDSEGQACLFDVEAAFVHHSKLLKELQNLEQDPAAIERQLDLIAFQMEDIDSAQLSLEDEVLETRLDAMKHAEGIIQDLEASTQLIDAEGEAISIVRLMHELIRKMERNERFLPQYKDKREWLTDVLYQLKDLADEQSQSAQGLMFDPYELLQLEKRVDQINHLKKKYGPSIGAILDFRRTLDTDQEALIEAQGSKDKLLAALSLAKARYGDLASSLSGYRTAVAKHFSKDLTQELKALNFKDAEVLVQLDKKPNMSLKGDDHMELMVALNKGMPLAPLKRVASGGEISRLMLAIKAIVANKDRTETLIFDEIDTGISGHTATVVGEKLYSVSRGRQVICITHLAQVALMADQHFLIEKDASESRPVSRVIPLDDHGSALEIARIMSGKSTVSGVVDHAVALLGEAREKKQNF